MWRYRTSATCAGKCPAVTQGAARLRFDAAGRYSGSCPLLRRLVCRQPSTVYVRPVLSPRQRQVVALVAQALPNKEIARELRLTEETVKQYLQRIQLKLGLRNRTHLAIWTTQHDLSCPLTIP